MSAIRIDNKKNADNIVKAIIMVMEEWDSESDTIKADILSVINNVSQAPLSISNCTFTNTK